MKFYSKPIVEHNEVPLADDGRLEEIVAHWQQREITPSQNDSSGNNTDSKRNDCYVVSAVFPADPYPAGKLAEILGLVKAQGDNILGHELIKLAKPNPKTFLGRGISEDIAARANEIGANMLVLDAELSPSQTRNLENMVGIPICDREAVILNVFLRHAKTRSARNQVEIAQLQYLRPRIRGLGLNMDQQAGGIMGGRGPGESASELMARRLDSRLAQLTKSSKRLSKAGECQRQSRSSCKRIALVGYTNAGKTSLMNGLTSAGLSARNLPFETLDTTTRVLHRQNSGDVLLSDTVGFIRALPNRLLASFESTLAETIESDLLVIVVDAADPERELHIRTTEELLFKLKANDIPRFFVFNKSDKLISPLSVQQCRALSHGNPYMNLSSLDNKSIASLHTALISEVSAKLQTCKLFVPYKAQDIITRIYAKSRVIKVHSDESGLSFILEGDGNLLAQLQRDSEEAQK